MQQPENRQIVRRRKADKRAWQPVRPWNPYVPHVKCFICREPLDQKQLKREGSVVVVVDGVRCEAHVGCVETLEPEFEGPLSFALDYDAYSY